MGGEVDADAFGALIAGTDPKSGEVLRPGSGRDRVCAFDLTFSALKSVSVLFAIGDGETSGALVEAHEEAVGAAIGYLERGVVCAAAAVAGSSWPRRGSWRRATAIG